jgi:hypothetical protein
MDAHADVSIVEVIDHRLDRAHIGKVAANF